MPPGDPWHRLRTSLRAFLLPALLFGSALLSSESVGNVHVVRLLKISSYPSLLYPARLELASFDPKFSGLLFPVQPSFTRLLLRAKSPSSPSLSLSLVCSDFSEKSTRNSRLSDKSSRKPGLYRSHPEHVRLWTKIWRCVSPQLLSSLKELSN